MNKSQKFEIPVHPLAALFPMMPDDELAALAADIKAHGLMQPIMTDETGMLIDGRNRLKACGMAGVEPVFKSYDGDPIAFIWSLNEHRRHMTKGARAMVAALADPVGHSGKKTSLETKEVKGASEAYISKARAVIRYAPDLAEGVRIGKMALDEAYKTAKISSDAANSSEASMEKLRRLAPDLADRVLNDGFKLTEAMAACEQRLSEQLTQQRAATANLARICGALESYGAPPDEAAEKLFGAVNIKFWQPTEEPLTAEGLRAAAILAATAALLENGRFSK